ncbi:MAG: acyltransferase [Sphingobacteriales bacterium]|nr:MAG: acyltransferase [Sphingobacteriales bacterium]
MQTQDAVLADKPVFRSGIKQNLFKNAAGNKRLGWIDYARGLAILLVVYRHSVIGIQRSGSTVPSIIFYLQEFVYNFRMPVFFLLSGFFLSFSLKKYSVPKLISKKAKTLLYPYILWSIILITLQIIMSRYTNTVRTIRDYQFILTQPRQVDHMWYLLALFNTSALFLLLYNWLGKLPLVHVAVAIMLHFSCFLFQDYSFFSDLCYYYIYLVLGVVLAGVLIRMESSSKRKLTHALIVVVPFFILGQFLWLYNQPETITLTVPFLMITLIACAFFYLICKIFYSSGWGLWLTEIGRNSLQIYILHILIISSFRIAITQVVAEPNIYLLLCGSMILGIAGPILIHRLLQYWGFWFLFSLEKPSNK